MLKVENEDGRDIETPEHSCRNHPYQGGSR